MVRFVVGRKAVRNRNPVQQARVPFKKNSGLKFRKFHVPNGTVSSGCTDPTQATARLVIILVSKIKKKDWFWGQQFCQMERVVSVRPTEITGPVKVSRTKPKWSVPFDVLTEISGIWGWMKSAPSLRHLGHRSEKLKNKYAKALVEGQKWTTICCTSYKNEDRRVLCTMCFLSIRIVAPGNLALTTGRATWDILRRNTFVFVRLATMAKTVKN